MADADTLKNQGNKLYSEKKYAEACRCYEQAASLTPENYVLYNNIAAAKLALRLYDEAITNAKKALKIRNNYKSHSRIGTALLAQNKIQEAREAFLATLSLDPTNEATKAQLASIDKKELQSQMAINARYGLPPPLGGEFVPCKTGTIGLLASLIAIATGFVCVLGTFLRFSFAGLFWKVELLSFMVEQILIVKNRRLARLTFKDVGQITQHHSTLTLALCVFLLLSSPHYLVGTFITIYSVLDVGYRKAEVIAFAGPMQAVLAPRLHWLEENLIQVRVAASSFEAFTLVTCLFPNGNYVFPIVYTQYILYRYRRDVFVQAGFAGIKQSIEKITCSSYAPPIVDRLFQKLCSTLARYAQPTN